MKKYTKKVIKTMKILKGINCDTFYEALAIYEIIGDVEPTDEQVDKVNSFLDEFLKNNSMYNEYVREKIENIFYSIDEGDDEDEE